MKKILSFALLLCCFAVANAQVGFVANGHTYQDGDTIVVTLQKTDLATNAISFQNQTSSDLTGLTAAVTELEQGGVSIWALCAGQCVPALTSTPFDIPANSVYSLFEMDLEIDANVENPYGVYKMEVFNSEVSNFVYVRLQAYTLGINEAQTSAAVQAYPNPAEGQFSISYSVSQPSTLAIFDVQGRMVRQMPVNGEGAVKVSDLAAGVYAYGILENGRAQMQKLIVK